MHWLIAVLVGWFVVAVLIAAVHYRVRARQHRALVRGMVARLIAHGVAPDIAEARAEDLIALGQLRRMEAP